MTLAIALSLFFGLVAALSIGSCLSSIRKALNGYRAIRAELKACETPRPIASGPLRRPQEAFARAAA